MTPFEDLTSLSRDALVALVAALQRQVAELRAANDALRTDIARLTREGKRQAAPFSKGARVSQPKRPGRKPGSGTFHYRAAPLPEQLTEPPVDVPVLLAACPVCGGQLIEERVDFAYTTDIPASPRPHVTQYRVAVCRCLLCGKQVRGQHPDVAPDQYGATAHRPCRPGGRVYTGELSTSPTRNDGLTPALLAGNGRETRWCHGSRG
jgi:hypothetical protein